MGAHVPTPTAVVTGASRGIGAAIAQRLAMDGYAVAVNYLGDHEAANAVVARIVARGGSAAAAQANVSDPREADKLIEQAAELGQLSVLVDNSGLSGTASRHDQKDDDELRRLVDVNILGVLLTCRAAVPLMSTKHGGAGGSIINLASVAARTGGLPGRAAYAGSKAAVVAFSHGLSTEIAAEGVRVNSVSPGIIRTDMTTDDGAAAGRQAPLGRLGRADEVAAAVSWLASDEAGFITGIDLTVSGGR